MDVLKKIKKIKVQTEETLQDAFSLVREIEDRGEVLKWCQWIRREAKKIPTASMYELTYKTYLLAAMRGDFDSYCIYLEKNREGEKRFYLPRRDVLLPLVRDLQDLFDGKLDFLGISLPPRVGKSTLCIFFMTFVMGHRPAVASVMSGHSDKLTDGFYREILSIITDNTQYLWSDVFPGVNIADNSAKNETVDLRRKRGFRQLLAVPFRVH